MEYIGQLIVFISALVAIKGGTWKDNEQGYKKVTTTGYLTIAFALFGFIISVYKTRQSAIENQSYRNVADTTQVYVLQMKDQLVQANKVIAELKDLSQRQDQTEMMEFVELEPGAKWYSNSLVYAGSIINFYGFQDSKGLHLYYEYREEPVQLFQNHGTAVLIGDSGKGYTICLVNYSDKAISGKVHVSASPHLRSAR